MRWIPMIAVATGAAATGCAGETRLEDDFSPEIGAWSDGDDGARLHGPYVEGSTFELRAGGIDRESDECGAWSIEADDENVLTTEEDLGCHHRFVAAAGGTTRVRLFEDGDERASATVEVARPDRATVHARGPMLVGLPEGTEPIERARVLQDGLATFLVRWWDGERELSGRVLEATAPEGLRLAPAEGMPRDNSWVQVMPRTDATGEVAIGFDGVVLTTLVIEPVAAATLDELTIVEAEDEGTLLLLPRDGDGEPVFGVQADWSVDGTTLEGEGDLLRYESGGDEKQVTARAEGLDASIDVALADPSVGSSNSCAAAPGGARGGALASAGGLGLAALLTRRRRRPA